MHGTIAPANFNVKGKRRVPQPVARFWRRLGARLGYLSDSHFIEDRIVPSRKGLGFLLHITHG